MSNMVLHGIQAVAFGFPDSPETTRETGQTLSPPPGTQEVTLVLQGFDMAYADDNQYGFGALGVSLQAASPNEAVCKAELRDNNVNKRVWGGEVFALAMFFGPPTKP
jgi:hypothetical protein